MALSSSEGEDTSVQAGAWVECAQWLLAEELGAGISVNKTTDKIPVHAKFMFSARKSYYFAII